MSIVNWIKQHITATLLILIVGYLLFNTFMNTFFGANLLNVTVPRTQTSMDSSLSSISLGAPSAGRTIYPIQPEFAPQPDVQDRLVIEQSNISLLVQDVTAVQNNILNFVRENGGYMVNTSLSNPEDAPNSTVTVRVPGDKLDTVLNFLRSQSVKVVSENLSGQDVTDQYVDVEERLRTLENTKARFETILNQAEEIDDISRVTQQIVSYQQQIDALKGQQQALEQNAQMAKITIYLSTDELALPYTPSETWRPEVIFKNAVRSLVSTLRGIGSLLIVVVVYSVIWLPALVTFLLIKKYRTKKQKNNSLS